MRSYSADNPPLGSGSLMLTILRASVFLILLGATTFAADLDLLGAPPQIVPRWVDTGKMPSSAEPSSAEPYEKETYDSDVSSRSPSSDDSEGEADLYSAYPRLFGTSLRRRSRLDRSEREICRTQLFNNYFGSDHLCSSCDYLVCSGKPAHQRHERLVDLDGGSPISPGGSPSSVGSGSPSSVESGFSVSNMFISREQCPKRCHLLAEDRDMLLKYVGNTEIRSYYVEKYAEFLDNDAEQSNPEFDMLLKWRRVMDLDEMAPFDDALGEKLRVERTLVLGLQEKIQEMTRKEVEANQLRDHVTSLVEGSDTTSESFSESQHRETMDRLSDLLGDDIVKSHDFGDPVLMWSEALKLLSKFIAESSSTIRTLQETLERKYVLLSNGKAAMVEKMVGVDGKIYILKRQKVLMSYEDMVLRSQNEVTCNVKANKVLGKHSVKMLGWYPELLMWDDDSMVQSVVTMVFEFIPQTLHDFLLPTDSKGYTEGKGIRNKPELLKQVLHELVGSVGRLNRAKLYHLDLKLDNVFVSVKDGAEASDPEVGDLVVKLGDWDRCADAPIHMNMMTSIEISPPEAAAAMLPSGSISKMIDSGDIAIDDFYSLIMDKFSGTPSQKTTKRRKKGSSVIAWDAWSVGVIIGQLVTGDYYWMYNLGRDMFRETKREPNPENCDLNKMLREGEEMFTGECNLVVVLNLFSSAHSALPSDTFSRVVGQSLSRELFDGETVNQLANLMGRLLAKRKGTRGLPMFLVYHEYFNFMNVDRSISTSNYGPQIRRHVGGWHPCNNDFFPVLFGPKETTLTSGIFSDSAWEPTPKETTNTLLLPSGTPNFVVTATEQGARVDISFKVFGTKRFLARHAAFAVIYDDMGEMISRTSLFMSSLFEGGIVHMELPRSKMAEYADLAIEDTDNSMTSSRLEFPGIRLKKVTTGAMVVRVFLVDLVDQQFTCQETAKAADDGLGYFSTLSSPYVSNSYIHDSSEEGHRVSERLRGGVQKIANKWACVHVYSYFQQQILLSLTKSRLELDRGALCSQEFATYPAAAYGDMRPTVLRCNRIRDGIYEQLSSMVPSAREKAALVGPRVYCNGNERVIGDTLLNLWGSQSMTRSAFERVQAPPRGLVGLKGVNPICPISSNHIPKDGLLPDSCKTSDAVRILSPMVRTSSDTCKYCKEMIMLGPGDLSVRCEKYADAVSLSPKALAHMYEVSQFMRQGRNEFEKRRCDVGRYMSKGIVCAGMASVVYRVSTSQDANASGILRSKVLIRKLQQRGQTPGDHEARIAILCGPDIMHCCDEDEAGRLSDDAEMERIWSAK